MNRQEYMISFIKTCNLESNHHVCDVGTGTGIVANALYKYCSKVDAFDISEDMSHIAKEKNH